MTEEMISLSTSKNIVYAILTDAKADDFVSERIFSGVIILREAYKRVL